ncbi:MAG: cysteine hydrolase [Rhizobacter sp.]|nr:cysteine hydrolase [Rhizobacter sp.]
MSGLVPGPSSLTPSSTPSSTPSITVVLALHYQNDVLHPDGKIRVGIGADSPDRARVIEAATALLAGARERGWPILHVRVAFRPDGADIIQNCAIFKAVHASGATREGTWGAEFYTPLAPDAASPREFVVKHSRIDAFYGSPLDETLRRCNAARLVIAGVATHSVVESTVRHAADIGFDTWVAADACAAALPAVHEASLASMKLIATVSTVQGCIEG